MVVGQSTEPEAIRSLCDERLGEERMSAMSACAKEGMPPCLR
jgi:hypothetical protein